METVEKWWWNICNIVTVNNVKGWKKKSTIILIDKTCNNENNFRYNSYLVLLDDSKYINKIFNFKNFVLI